MRAIQDHIAYQANEGLDVRVLDNPGRAGACHEYLISSTDESVACRITFQNGSIKDADVNGVTNEALLAVAIDRLRSFQAGPLSCQDNAKALRCCEDALMWLQHRTLDRLRRGVLGTDEP
jgi:hypothetical protein